MRGPHMTFGQTSCSLNRGAAKANPAALILTDLLLLRAPLRAGWAFSAWALRGPETGEPDERPTKAGAGNREGPFPMSSTQQQGHDKDRVVIFDTTLRDGEQSPGATMTHEEKLEVAELLDEMGVDIIEAGFPIASEGDFEAVHEIAKRAKNAVICGLARAAFKDIDRCAEAIKPAKRGRIHTFLSTSPVHMKYKLQKEPHEVFEMVIAQVTRARNYTDDVEWSCRGRHPHRDRLPVPLRRGRDQGRRDHDQHSRHRRLHGAGGILRAVQDGARARAEFRQGGVLGALP